MPKQLLEIKDFQGVVSNVDETDMPPNVASFTLDVDSNSEHGILKGRHSDATFFTPSDKVGHIGSAWIKKLDGSDVLIAFTDYDNTLNYSHYITDFYGTPAKTQSTYYEADENISVAPISVIPKNTGCHIAWGVGKADGSNYNKAQWAGYNAHAQQWLNSGNVDESTIHHTVDEASSCKSKITITGTQSGGTADSSIISGYKYFYKVSLTYDGYQESPLTIGASAYSITTASTAGIKVTIQLDNTALGNIPSGNDGKINPRVSHVNLYRAYNPSGGAVEETPYRFIKQIPTASGWTNTSSTLWTQVIEDTGIATSSYEAITGINEVVGNTNMIYELSTDLNDSLFVGNCINAYENPIDSGAVITDKQPNYIYKSKPFKYSIFDWSVDFLVLPTTPTALTNYNGRLYAFSENAIYRIEPNNFYIEDTYYGAGCVNKGSVVVTEQAMYFADKNHIYMHNGNQPVIISTPIESFYKTNKPLISGEQPNIGYHEAMSLTTNKDKHRLIYDTRTNLLICFVLKNTGIDNEPSGYQYAWVYNTKSNRWDVWSFNSISNDYLNAFTGLKGESFYWKGGTGNNTILTHISPFSSNRSDFWWQSHALNAGSATQEKVWIELKTNNPLNSFGADQIIQADYNNGTTFNVVNDEVLTKTKGKTFHFRVRSQNQSTNQLASLGIVYRTLRGTPT